jgi:type II secretory pathway pseudopilin PulG
MRAVNLIPQDQRGGATRGAGRSQGGAYAVLGVVAGLALLALVYGVAAHQVSSRKAKLVSVEARAQQAQATAAQLAPYTSFQSLREQRVNAVNQLVNSRFDWAHAFHEFGRVLPPEVSITSIAGTITSAAGAGSGAGASTANSTSGPSSSGGVQAASGPSGGSGSVASATPPGSVPTFTLTGCAVNQSSVALTLERLRLMDGVSTVSLQSSTKSAAGGGSAGGGACPASYPVFNAQITFDALPASSIPTASATAKAAKLSGGA